MQPLLFNNEQFLIHSILHKVFPLSIPLKPVLQLPHILSVLQVFLFNVLQFILHFTGGGI